METSAPAIQRDDELLLIAPEIAALLPEQGAWSEHDYLWLTDGTNRLVEFTDGFIEVLPMPTEKHQAISLTLLLAFLDLMRRTNGKVYYSPLRIRVGPRRFREPDLLLLQSADDPRRADRYWSGADLVVEIVSPDNPERDHVTKRADYAAAEILEYWIVDPQRETITVLRLVDKSYAEHGVFGRGAIATSALFSDFEVAVDAVLDAT